PGGIGKTRLAVEVAEGLVDRFADGVWLIELATLRDEALVARSVAATFDVREEPNRPPEEELVEVLRRKRLLVLLDNCEHVLDATAALVDTLLSRCPDLRVLTTSRQALGMVGETVYRVPALRLPDGPALHTDTGGVDLARLAVVEAVDLFVDRARARSHSFALSEENASAVARAWGMLDGSPFRLDLPAAWVPVLPVEGIAGRLDDCFRLLTGGSRRALPRQQTMQAALDWSYDLLSEPERLLFGRLSIFAGGFT